MRKVELVNHKEEWPKMFKDESEKIKAIFGNDIIHIYHIGSTAIPNIKAKPIIDIMVEVKRIEKADEMSQDLKRIGYEDKGEFGIAGRRFFIKGGDNRTHHVHFFEKGNKEIARHIAFRDFMTAHPEEALKYSELKQQLAFKYPMDIEKYMEGKSEYIREIDKRAETWRDQI